MINSVSNLGDKKCTFGGINVGKRINAGVKGVRNFTKTSTLETDKFEKIQNKAVKDVLGGPQGHPYTGRDLLSNSEHSKMLQEKLAQWKEQNPTETTIKWDEVLGSDKDCSLEHDSLDIITDVVDIISETVIKVIDNINDLL